MSKYLTSITKDQLPAGRFEGYYWYSDQVSPELLEKDTLKEDWFTELPFIIEASFYDTEQQISVSVQNLNGQYMITRADLKAVPSERKQFRKYIAVNGKHFRMCEIWDESQPLEHLENMTVLQPTYMAFAGFIN